MKLRTDRLRLALALTLLLVGAAASAADFEIPLDRHGLPLWEIRTWDDFPVRIELAEIADLDALLAAVPIASFDRDQIAIDGRAPTPATVVFTPRVTAEEFAALERLGYAPERVRDLEREGREAVERAWREQVDSGATKTRETYPLTYYPNYDQLGTLLQNMEVDHPERAEYFALGSSVNGRTQHGVIISDNIGVEEAEPEVRLTSSMHGDEVVDMVMLLNFAYYLLENYGVPGREDVTNLVDNYEIHIVPHYNPDGYVAGTRYNAHGVDLNRNFPLPAGTDPITEIENINFMAHANRQHFVISQNGHGGALVINYPWDYTYALTPDDAAIQLLSLEYSTYNLPMYNGSWPQGIVRGAVWYVITGGLQDWSYDQTDCIDVTNEVSNVKWPNAGTLAGFWNDNRESLMHFTKAARYGVNGVVTDADTGLPLDATVAVTGIAKDVHTDPACGDYYKLLHTGTFELTFSAVGYESQTIAGVSTTWGTPTVLDVQLQPLPQGPVSGTVTDDTGTGLDATIEVTTRPGGELVVIVASDAGAGGAYATSLYYGDYTLTATADGFFPESVDITVDGTPVEVDFQLGGMVIVEPIVEDFESGAGVFSGDWFVTDAYAYESTQSLTDSEGSYPDNATLLATTSSIDLSAVTEPEARFMARWSIENYWDAVFFEISADGGASWAALATQYTEPASGQGAQTPSGTPCFDGPQVQWVYNTADLSAYAGEADVRFRFRLASDMSTHYDGFYLDDFVVRAIGEAATDVETPVRLIAEVKAFPNPFNPQTTLAFTVPRSGHVELAIFDLQGHHVRTLVDTSLPAGPDSVIWDGRADDGRTAGSGVYLARLVAGPQTSSAKLMLLK